MAIMTVKEIRSERISLEKELNAALGRMELNPNITLLHTRLINLQHECPHNDGTVNYSLEHECPFCGKIF